jgi:phosphatidylinositol alpha-1,6-mannosyltransferase
LPERTPGHALDVVLLADRTPPGIGGRESLLRELLARQPAERTRLVTTALAGARAFDRSCPAAIHRCPRWPWLAEGAARWIRRTHLHWVTRRRPPGMVVAFGLAEGALALEQKRALDVPYVLHLEAPELHEARRELRVASDRGRALQEVLDESEALVLATRACRLEAYKAGVLPHRLEVIPPGVDIERFRPGPKPAELAKRYDASRGPVVLSVAGRGPAKDPDTILRAFAGIRAQRSSAVLLVVGPVGPAWHARAQELRAQGVRFAGVVPEGELADHYRLADVFLLAHPPRREAEAIPGVELALVEAMASGVPVAATRTGSVEEIAPSEEVGTLVEAEGHGKLARAALDLLRGGERVEEVRRAARERAVAEYSADASAARFREFLEVVYFRRLSRGRLAHEEESAPAAPAAA